MHPSVRGLWRGDGAGRVWCVKETASEQGQRGASLPQPPGLTCPLGLQAQRWGRAPRGARLYQGRGGAVYPEDGPIRVSTAPALDAPEPSAAAAGRLESDSPPARSRAGPPGAPLDPSLTQADRFLLVFRVCFCLAPFEIGYDVGGKAAASKPHANPGEQAPVVSWTDGQRVGKDDLALFSLTSLTAFMMPYCRGKRELNVF